MIADRIASMSPRERTLAAATALVCIAGLGFLIVRAGMDRSRLLDRRIAQLEQEVISLTARAAEVNSIRAAMESSTFETGAEMTEAELHDALRREIFQLALRDESVPIQDGAPALGAQFLVQIPTLKAGRISGEGEGFREYSVQVDIPSAKLADIVLFLDRLRQSAHLLRVDRLELTRPPTAHHVAARMEITRIAATSRGEIDL